MKSKEELTPPNFDPDEWAHKRGSAATGLSYDMLSEQEIAEIRAQAKAKVAAEQKAAAKKRVLEEAVHQERLAAGLVPEKDLEAAWRDELVEVYIQLPRQGPRDHPTLMIDQRIFHSGRAYTVNRAQAMTINDMQQRQRWHQSQIKGESRNYYDEIAGGMMYQGGRARGTGGMA